jgi:hypothetical protein
VRLVRMFIARGANVRAHMRLANALPPRLSARWVRPKNKIFFSCPGFLYLVFLTFQQYRVRVLFRRDNITMLHITTNAPSPMIIR